MQIWQEVLQVEPIGVTENFFELGGHSLLAIRLIAVIEKQMGCSLPVVALFRRATVEAIAALIAQGRMSSDADLVVPLQTKGDLPPLFLVHQAGGYALSYSVLARSLGEERPVYALQARGLDRKQPPLKTIESMASTYLRAIRVIQPKGPYWLGGHSLGGLIAFEMASQLVAGGVCVENLLIIDTHPPLGNPEMEAAVNDEAAILCFITEQIGLHFHTSVKINHGEIVNLQPAARLEYVLQILHQHQLIPRDSGRELIAGLLNVYQANLQANLSYQPMPIPGSTITLFKTAALAAQFLDDPTLGWGQLTSEEVQVYSVTGEHQTLLQEPYVTQLANLIRGIEAGGKGHEASLPL